MNIRHKLTLLIAAAVVFLAGQASSQDKGWRPVTAEEIQLKNPKVEPDADAEVLLWEVRVADEYDRQGFRTNLEQYIRIKIFTERGRDEYGRIDIPFGSGIDAGVNISLKDIAARTINPDGSILELKPEEIFERDVVKGRDIKLKAKSFALPGVAVGSIIEYRWKEIRNNSISFYVRLDLAREIPIHFVKYSIKPLTNIPLGLRLHSLNTEATFAADKGGYFSSSMSNVPSFKEEPSMPAEYSVRPWVLVYYDNDKTNGTAQEYWRNKGRKTYEDHKLGLKASDDIRQAAKEAIGDASAPDEIAHRIFDFCRKNIRYIDDDAAGVTAEERKNFKENKTTSDTLKHGYGTAHDINMIFGAMLDASGMDVRVANVAIRSDPPLNKDITNSFFIRTEIIAVKMDNDWRFFAPSRIYEQYGSLCSCEEGQWALVSDPKEPFWLQTQLSDAARSKQKRTVTASLNEDGTIEGEAKIEFTGHLGRYYRKINDGLAAAEREKILTDEMKKRMSSTIEVSSISVDNIKDVAKPFTYGFKFRIPAYVDRAGKRIFLQPNVFEKASAPRFITNFRKNDLDFDYPWSEEDEITIKLPAGYTLDNSELWAPVVEPHGVGSMTSDIALSEDKTALIYKRLFVFGNKGKLEFVRNDYSPVKGFFDKLHQADQRSVILQKQSN